MKTNKGIAGNVIQKILNKIGNIDISSIGSTITEAISNLNAKDAEIDNKINVLNNELNVLNDNLSHTVMHSYADYYSADWHNESDVANGRCYLNIATENDLNLTANTFTTICTGYPKPVLIERIPCIFIVGNSHLIGVAKMTLDGELQLNPPQTISGARCYINASYRIAT